VVKKAVLMIVAKLKSSRMAEEATKAASLRMGRKKLQVNM